MLKGLKYPAHNVSFGHTTIASFIAWSHEMQPFNLSLTVIHSFIVIYLSCLNDFHKLSREFMLKFFENFTLQCSRNRILTISEFYEKIAFIFIHFACSFLTSATIFSVASNIDPTHFTIAKGVLLKFVCCGLSSRKIVIVVK